jgi:hypothetical protein
MSNTVYQSIEEVLEERGKTHGDFRVQSSVSQQLKTVIKPHTGGMSATKKEALEMIVHKVARILAGNSDVQDHWDDIAGYSLLVSNLLKEENGYDF